MKPTRNGDFTRKIQIFVKFPAMIKIGKVFQVAKLNRRNLTGGFRHFVSDLSPEKRRSCWRLDEKRFASLYYGE